MARTNKNDQHPGMDREQKRVMFDNMNFAAAEAYKLLRTNLMFSFSESAPRRWPDWEEITTPEPPSAIIFPNSSKSTAVP